MQICFYNIPFRPVLTQCSHAVAIELDQSQVIEASHFETERLASRRQRKVRRMKNAWAILPESA